MSTNITKYLRSKFSFNREYPFHHSHRHSLENKIYAAIDFQCPFLPKPVEAKLKRIVEGKEVVEMEPVAILEKIISSTYLITFNRPGSSTALKFAGERLSKVMTYRMKKGENYYLSEDEKRKLSIPKKYWRKPVVNPSFDPYVGECPLPLIHDIYLMRAALPGLGKGFTAHRKQVIRYILSDAYQCGIPRGYGYSYFLKIRRVYGTGWSCHLRTGEKDRRGLLASGLPSLALFAAFPEADSAKTFKKAKRLVLGELRKNNGEFPSSLMTQSKQGYAVTGAFMSFGDISKDSRHRLSLKTIRQLMKLDGAAISSLK